MNQTPPTNPMYCDYADGTAFTVIGIETQNQPIIFNSPHSGNCYPKRFLNSSCLTPQTIRLSEDMAVDELFSNVPKFGAILQKAHFPRAYLDVNRKPYELDESMYLSSLPDFAKSHSHKTSSGLGTIAKIVAPDRPIYRNKLDPEDALTRIESIYKPYHNSLRRLISQTYARTGFALLIDCHSMPSHQYMMTPRSGAAADADIIIGDRYGTSCQLDIIEKTLAIFRALGFKVAQNKPYAGGFITQHYGQPQHNLHAFQIEINRKLYMDEQRLEKHHGFDAIQNAMTEFARKLMEYITIKQIENKTNIMPLAAE